MNYRIRVIFLIFLGLSLLFRFTSLFPVVIDHDESTYAVMADHMLQGSLLYKDVIDIKQPGIFLIFCAIQLLCGKSILAIRLAAAVAVAITATCIYQIKLSRGSEFEAAFLGGFISIVMMSLSFGLAANTEIFFVTFSAMAVAVLFSGSSDWIMGIAGLLMGLGLIVKQHILFDVLAIGLWLMAFMMIEKKWKRLPGLLLAGVGLVLPALVVPFYYWATGNFEYYLFITYVAPGNYQSEFGLQSIGKMTRQLFDNYGVFLVLAIPAFWSPYFKDKKNITLSVLWLCTSFLAVIATGKNLNHYLLQFVLPVSIVVGELATVLSSRRWFRPAYGRYTLLSLTLLLAIAGNIHGMRYHKKCKDINTLHSFLEQELNDGDGIYTGDGPQVLYWLLDRKSPTPYVHASLMTVPEQQQTLEIKVQQEFESVLDYGPEFIIMRPNHGFPAFREMIKPTYDLVPNETEFELYRRQEDAVRVGY